MTIADILARAHRHGVLRIVGNTKRLALYGPPLHTTVIAKTKPGDEHQ